MDGRRTRSPPLPQEAKEEDVRSVGEPAKSVKLSDLTAMTKKVDKEADVLRSSLSTGPGARRNDEATARTEGGNEDVVHDDTK